ncbi:MAG: hypothetical protein H7837_12990 [Magnetococcus sp. MYC-9]
MPPSDPIPATSLAAAREAHRLGALEQAWTQYEALRALAPNDPELLHLTSLICIRRKAYPEAIDRIQRARVAAPDSPVLLYNLGLAWMQQGDEVEALRWLTQAVERQPDYVNALCQRGRLFIRRQEPDRALQDLGRAVRLEPTRAELHELLAIALFHLGLPAAAHYRRRLASYHGHRPLDRDGLPPQHTFFVDPQRALSVARQGNRVQESIQTTGLQLCYYEGEPLPEAPPTLIRVPSDPQQAVYFFCFSSLTWPVEIDFDPAVERERVAGSRLAASLNRARQARREETRRLAQVSQSQRPLFLPDQPLRVYLPASRHGDVLRYNARDLAEGFRKNGCEVLYHVEPTPMETFDFHHWLQAQEAFRPHLVLDINHAFNLASGGSFQGHPDLFRILWFEDPSPALMAGSPLPWRPRDLVYSVDRELDRLLYRCGAKEVKRQGFCYDEEIFRDCGHPRHNKVVLVASSHDFVLHHFAGCKPLLARLEAMLTAGEAMTEATLDRLAADFPFRKEDISIYLWGYVIRNLSARWLCELAGEIDVEVYGHRWAADPVVRPFYRGILPHGPAVATVYNEARYALVNHPFDLHSQRLMEVSACGAVPIVYDCRERAGTPDWNNHCLWYRTQADLRRCLREQPLASAQRICQGSSYTEFARRILADVASRLAITH